MPHIKRQAEQVMAEFDAAPDGKVIRTQYVLQGNIFRACELASKQKLGSPILFTDEEGNRQRAVLLKDRITPDMVKALPIGLMRGTSATTSTSTSIRSTPSSVNARCMGRSASTTPG
ncbi:hypothetical protein [Aeromonas veronii]|uniref:hypothetical protein n=1 Tax=Aeromonas veronii TaxID=654 RepID=UPI001F0B5069|nr:hypothetical protein [Aeromonas veronii]